MKRHRELDDSRNGWYDITPAEASELVAGQILNRPLSPSKINRITKKILAKKFARNGESLVFSWDGRLLDGQHRLRAAITSGTTITVVCVFLWKMSEKELKELFDTIDSISSPRTPADRLVQGGASVADARFASAIIRALLQFTRYGHVSQAGADHRTATDHFIDSETVRLYWEENRKQIDDCVKAVRMYHNLFRSLAPASLVGLVYLKAAKYDQKKADDFLHRFSSGEKLDMDSPILQVRRKLQQDSKTDDEKLSTQKKAALLIKAWNQHATGEKKALVWDRRESFPSFVGDEPKPRPAKLKSKKERAA